MTANAKNLSTLANVLDDGTSGQILQSTGSGGVVFANIAAGASVYDSAALLPLAGNDAGDMAFVTATSHFYINNGTGWYSVNLINTDPAITSVQDASANTTPFTLSTDGSATVITITANDPEQVPLTYSYAVTTGSLTNGGGTTATVTQSDNVFTVTPSTTEAYAGTFNLTFTASDGINTATSDNNFTLQFVTTITNSKYTTLLATATGGSDNNNITDASSNNHSITIGGDTYAGTFSPYRNGGYSTYFDGSGGDYVKSPTHADFGFSTDDFTIECWYYPVSKAQNYPRIWHFGPYWSNANSLAFQDRHNSWSTTFSLVAFSGGEILNSTTTVENGNWYHLAVERSGTTITLYVNGVAEDTYNIGTSQFITSSTNYVTIGNVSDGANLNESALNGYIRDFRYVKGTAVYNGNFTPTTESLEVITNTKLFTAHLPYIIDGSTNSHSITVNGDVFIKPFSPYDYNEYSATDRGGSIYFDGTGDYLSISNQEISGDLTYEGWFYQTVAQSATYRTLISSSTYASGVPFRAYTNNTNIQVWTDGSNQAEITAPFKAYTWFHIAIVRSSGTWTLYVNGKSVGTTTVGGTYDFASTTGWSIGGSQTGSFPFTGYASDVKLTNSAVYTADFTLPTAPISSSGSELHIKGTDASIIDKSQTTNIKLVGGTNGTTTQAKFANTWSMYFDASGDYIDITEGFIPLRTSDFTIETWFYPTVNPSNHEGILCYGAHGSGNYLQLLYQTNRLIRYDIYADVGGGSTSNLSTTAVSLNTWCHIALCRSGGNIRLYVNGTQEHTEANSSDLNFTQANTGYETIAVIGNRTGLTGYALNSAYLQDFRITKGLARYTANFTPPTASLEG